MSYIIYDFFVLVFSSIISVFFREIKSRGSHKIPPFGPVIFVVAPHHNQFVDPLILMKTCKRRVGFLAAQKTMDRRYVGAFAKALQSIGVTRAQDIAKPGTGTVYYPDPRNAPNTIKGHNTKFTQELKPSWAIALPKNLGSADVAEIISDTEIRLKKPFKDDEAVAALSIPEGTSFKAVPHVDYSVVYNKVFERLNLGRCIGIFPEGGSHDRSELLPLKAGATIMALGAMAANPTLDVKVVPVGLSYFHADKFRSRAVVEYGDPISIPKELVEKYKNGGQDKRNACSALLETIHAGLKAVTVTAPDYGTLMVVQAVRRLYRPLNRRLTVVQKLEFTRRLIKGYLHYRDDPRIKDLEQKVLNYNQMLKYHGLQDHQVEKTAIGGFRAMQLLMERLSLLVLVGIIALPGAILNAPIAIMASKVSKRKAKEGLAASSVKIEGRDLLATWKLISACILVPTFYIGYTIIAYLLAWKFLGYPWTVVAPIATFYGVPIMSYLALIFGESWRDVYKSLPPLFFSILPTRWSSSQNLRQARAALSRDLNDIINELGPTLFPDFNTFFLKDYVIPRAQSQTLGLRRVSSWVTNMLSAGEGFFRWEWELTKDEEPDDVFFFETQEGKMTGRRDISPAERNIGSSSDITASASEKRTENTSVSRNETNGRHESLDRNQRRDSSESINSTDGNTLGEQNPSTIKSDGDLTKYFSLEGDEVRGQSEPQNQSSVGSQKKETGKEEDEDDEGIVLSNIKKLKSGDAKVGVTDVRGRSPAKTQE